MSRHAKQEVIEYWTCPCGWRVYFDTGILEDALPDSIGLLARIGMPVTTLEVLPDCLLQMAEDMVESHDKTCAINVSVA